VLDLLLRLVRKSLVVAEVGGQGAERYRLLETLRQYANERLTAHGEQDLVRDQHASYYLALVDEVEPSIWELAWLNRLLPEQDNLRAALRWLTESNAVERAVRLGGRLWPMWLFSGYLTEGQAQLRTLLALPVTSRRSPEWARLAMNAGLVEMFAGDFATARLRLEEAVAIRRAIDDPHLARTLCFLGLVARDQADYAAASLCFEESLALAQQLGDRICIVHALSCRATIAHELGDYVLARERYAHALALAREWDDRVEAPWLLHNLGCLALDEGDYAAAREWLTQGLTSRSEYDSLGFVHALAEFAALAAAERLPEAALRLEGATAALTQRTGIVVQPHERRRCDPWLATARQALGDEAAAAAWEDGRQMRLAEAIGYAQSPHELAAVTCPASPQPEHHQTREQLTPRQREVAALIARGHSNRQIGKALVITERTVAAHVEHILNKLEFASRTQIGVWASEHGLLVSSNA
jgi:non-specific serine/threonine protein kinase